MKHKVFVLHDAPFDFAPAEKWGEVHFITKAQLRSHQQAGGNAQVKADINKFLREYRAGEDFIVLTGDPLAMWLLGASIEAAMPNQTHKILKWNARRADYTLFSLKQETTNEFN